MKIFNCGFLTRKTHTASLHSGEEGRGAGEVGPRCVAKMSKSGGAAGAADRANEKK